MVADDKLYMDMQEAFLEIASSTPTPRGCSGQSARASQSAAGAEHSKPPKQKSPENTAKVKKRSKKAARVEAGKIAAQRPTPPMPKEHAKETAEPDKTSPDQETPKEESQAQESSSYYSSSTSSSSSDAPDEPGETEEPHQKEETGQSSEDSITPDRAQKAIDRADLPTLDIMQKAAEKRVDVLESELTAAKNYLKYIIKRRKIVLAREPRDVEMERVD